MAKITDTSGSSNIWLGSKWNAKQTIIYAPASSTAGGGTADKPGLVFLEAVDSTGAMQTGLYLWADSAGALRYSGTYPTDEDGSGSVIGTTGSYAATTLADIASVAIPNGGDLLPANSGQVTLGDATHLFDDLFFNGDVYAYGATRYAKLTFAEPGTASRAINFPDPGADVDVVYTSTSQALTTKTYNGMSVTAAGNAINLVQGSGNITVGAAGSLDVGAAGTFDVGTGTVAFTGAADFDQADGTTADINGDITIGTGGLTTSTTAVVLDQDLQVSASVEFASITDGTATLTSGGLTGLAGLTSTDHIHIDADSKQLQLGAETTDSYIYFDGTHMQFYDTNLGATASLTDLASGALSSPTVTGDMTISDGKITWNDGTNEVAGAWTFDSNTTANAINISMDTATSGGAIAITNTGGTFTGNAVSVDMDAASSGTGYYVSIDESTPMTGYYYEAHSGSATVFGVKRYGEIEIAGSDTADMITITKGNLQVDDGVIQVDCDSNQANHIKRAYGSAATAPVLTLTDDTTGSNQSVLLVDQDNSGDYDAVQIQNAGTGYGVSTTGALAASEGYEFISAASATGKGINLDGTTSGAAWIGAANTGFLHVSSDGALAETTASMIYSTYTGNAAGASQEGTCGYFYDNSTASGTSYAVKITSTNNYGLLVSTAGTAKRGMTVSGPQAQTGNLAVFDGSTGTGWIGSASAGVVKITGNGDIADAAGSMLQIQYSGQGDDSATGTCIRSLDSGTAIGVQPAYANYFSSTNNDVACFVTGSVGVANITANSYTNQTESMVILDGTTANWVGATGNGMIEIHSDGTFAHADTSMIKCTKTGATVASMEGTCLNISDASTGGSTTGYAAYISASGATDALQIADGKTALADALTVTIASGKNVDAITIDNNESGNNKDSIVVTTAGTGFALKSTVETATGGGHKFIGATEQTTAIVTIDGTTTAGWDGAADVGMLELIDDGTRASASTSQLLIDFDGTYAANTLGGCLYIDDNGTAGGTDYSAYINANAVNGMLIRTAAATMTGLVIDGPASQTASMAKIDGSVGTWLGADGVGMLQLDNDGSFAHVNASMLLITNSGVPQDDSRGHCLRIVDTGNASAGTAAYAAYLSATDATVEALYVDAGEVHVDEFVKASPATATGGLVTRYYSADLTDTPTNAEFDTAFGATALGYAGFIGVAYDTSQTATYLVVSDGTDWYYTTKMTKAL